MKKRGRPRELRYVSKHGTRRVAHRTGTAAQVIGPLKRGDAVTGLTAGQFSAVDAMEHIVSELGCSDVMISTWTTGIYDVERTAAIQLEGRIKSIRLLLDRGTFEKSPQYAGPLIERLGVDAFRCLSVHAKVIIVRGERGSAVFRSSMNFNKNLRTEQFDVDVCDEMAEFYIRWFEALWLEAGKEQDNKAIIQAVYDRYLSGYHPPMDESSADRARPTRRAASSSSGETFDISDFSDFDASDLFD